MKVLDKRKFLDLPPGTIFAKGHPWAFGGLNVKMESILGSDGASIDYYYINICDIESVDSDDWGEQLDAALTDGHSLKINKTEARDGMFDEEEVFLIYEPADITVLTDFLKDAKLIA